MKIYQKKIAFAMESMHLIVSGGTGSFAKFFVDMCGELNWACDFILDCEPKSNPLVDYIKSKGSKFYYPKNPIGYKDYIRSYVFDSGMNIEKAANFRHAMMLASEDNLYDAIILNSPEPTLGIYSIDLYDYIPHIVYTHTSNVFKSETESSNIYSKSFGDISKSQLHLPEIISGTQSEYNRSKLLDINPNLKSYFLPMRIPEPALLEDNLPWDKKEGIIFIGRGDKEKNPEKFVDLIKKLGVKALVMTNQTSKIKFEGLFKEAGVTNYEIKVNITGKEKTDFIKSARMSIVTSKIETHSFAAYEALHSCPVFAYKKFNWLYAFDYNGRQLVHPIEKEDINFLKKVYDNPEPYYTDTLSIMKDIYKDVSSYWIKAIDENQNYSSSNRTDTKSLQIIKQGQISVRDIFFEKMKRKSISHEDVASIYSKRNLFNRTQIHGKTILHMGDYQEEIIKEDKNLFDI